MISQEKKYLLFIDNTLDNIDNITKNLYTYVFYYIIDINNFNVNDYDINNYDEYYILSSSNTDNNYKKYINLELLYSNTNIVLYYSDSITIPKPYLSISGGFFSINNILNSNINLINGEINLSGTDIGHFTLNINYTIASITISQNINVIVYPKIIYDTHTFNYSSNDNYIINKPTIIPNIQGTFKLNHNLTVIDINTGIITIDNKINSGFHNLNVEFIYNDLILNINVPFEIKTNIIYSKTFIDLMINTDYMTEPPINLINNGSFSIDNFNIDSNTGIIHFNSKFNLGYNYFTVLYNNIPQTNIILNVIPTFYYNNNLSIYFNQSSFSDIPFVDTNNISCYFELDTFYEHISINNNNGVLYFSENLNVGKYNIKVNLKVNNTIISFTYFLLTVLPYINYNNNTIYFDYNTNSSYNILESPILKPNNGTLVYDTSKLGIGYNQLNISYTVNNITSYFLLNIHIVPTVIYPQININYSDNILIIPSVSHLGGSFSLNNNLFNIDISNGKITSNNIDIDKYNLTINYNFHGFDYTYYYNFNVIPTIKYNNITNIYHDTFIISQPPIYSPINGNFKINSNSVSSLNNFYIDNYGRITFNKLSVGKYNFIIEYTVNNQTATFLYNLSVLPVIENNKIFNIDYNQGLNYTLISDPICNFKLVNEIENIMIIDNNLIVNKNCYCGIYNLDIICLYNNVEVVINYIINIYPIITYDNNIIINYNSIFTTKQPITQQTGGIYTLDIDKSLINNITIDSNTGIITIDKCNVGIYTIIVNYEINNIKNNTSLSLVVKPNLSYSNIKSIKYLEKVQSDKPNVDVSGGLFTLNNNYKNIFIDYYTGIIYFNAPDVGIYSIHVLYNINGTFTDFFYNITVYPIFELVNNNIITDYTENIILEDPIINPSNGELSIHKLDYIIGQQQIIYRYVLNYVHVEQVLNLTLLPNIKSDTIYKFYYNKPININFELLPNNGILTIDNNQFNIIDNTIISENINVGKYDITLKYTINNFSTTKNITIIIYPECYYLNNTFILNSFTDFSDLPTINPTGGIFTLDTNICTIDNNGKLIFDNINVKDSPYIFNIIYTYNNISLYILYTLIVNPLIEYEPNNSSIIYGFEGISVKPKLNHSVYNNFQIMNNNSILDNLINIDESGIIKFNKNIPIGKYKLTISCLLNNVYVQTNYYLEITQTIIYNTSIITLNYNSTYITQTPITFFSNGLFSSINLPNGVLLDSETGIIKVVNPDIGIYSINIDYNYKDTVASTIITLTILPTIIYENNVSNIKFGENVISNSPIVSHKNGIFDIDNILFNIDENGIITNKNKLDIDNYIINVSYKLNNLINTTKYQISCIPILYYNENIKEINYNDSSVSSIPTILPNFGLFKLKNHPYGVSINNQGIISFNNNIFVGNYNIDVIYQINNINTTFKYNLIIKPVFYYENEDILIYNKTIKSSKPFVNILNGYFEGILQNSNVSINNNTGILYFTNIEPGNYNFDIKYTLNNIYTITNYKAKILPNLVYDSSNYIINVGKSLLISPTVSPLGGTFILNNYNINSTTGEILFSNLDINNYTFIVEYNYNGNVNYFTINLTIQPDVYYQNTTLFYGESFILKPINNSPGGQFEPYEDIIINNTDTIGDYEYNISYTLNNITTHLKPIIHIVPKFYYEISYINIKYGTLTTSLKPIVNYSNDTSYFYIDKLDFITIDSKTGILTFDYIKLGEYDIIVYYKCNDIIVQTNYKVSVIPNFYYNESLICKKYNDPVIVLKPFCYPEYGTFSVNTLFNGITINNGVLYIDKVDIGEYTLEITYTSTNTYTKTYVTINIYPEIHYVDNILYGLFGTFNKSSLPIISPIGGNFICNDTKITVDGELLFDSSLPFNNYTITVEYIVNNMSTYTTFYYYLLPDIKNTILNYNINCDEQLIINQPYHLPTGGTFKIESNIDLNNNNGLITGLNLPIGNHKIKLYYTLNNTSSIIYNVNVYPVINYNLTNILIPYNSNTISVKPILIPENGIIISDYTNQYGQILFNKFLIGEHDINIQYNSNNIINNTNVSFEIIPNIIYTQTNYEINYGHNSFSSEPIIKSNIPITFVLFINGIEYNYIDSKGIINFSKLEVGNNILCVSLLNYINKINIIINVKVKPIITYNQTEIKLKYNDEYIIYPIISNLGGEFYMDNIENIVLVKDTGLLTIKSGLEPNNYNITINYKLNDIIVSNTINIIILPNFRYNIDHTIIKYNSVAQSIIPIIEPLNGTFYIDNSINGITIDNNGIIYFNNIDVGNYTIDIYYMKNTKIKTTYYLTVNPILYYPNDMNIFYYGFSDQDKINPIYMPQGGKLEINNINPNIGTYKTLTTYTLNNITVNTIYNYKIVPFIFYKNTEIYFGDNSFIVPILNLEDINGLFSIDNQNLLIDNNGIISNLNSLSVGKYKIKITYKYNNENYDTYLQLHVKPILRFLNNTKEIEYSYNNQIKKGKIVLNDFKIGNYNILIKSLESIEFNSELKINMNVILDKIYENTIYIITYGDNIDIKPLVNYGKFIINQSNININNGIINTLNLNVGYYNFIVTYINNGYTENIYFKITVLPKKLFNDEYIVTFGIGYILLPKDEYGEYINNNKYNKISMVNNKISYNNPLPDTYNFDVIYKLNNITISSIIKVRVKPIINFNENNIVIKHSDTYNNKIQFTPGGGNVNIISEIKDFITVKNNIITINGYIELGEHTVTIKYLYFKEESEYTFNVSILPKFEYLDNNKIISYEENVVNPLSISTLEPIISPYGGYFELLSNINGVTFNPKNGILYFDHVEYGKQDVEIQYIINNYQVKQIYKIEALPMFKYNEDLIINYLDDYVVNSSKPTYYPFNGKFSLSNNKNSDIISINSENGIVTVTNLCVGSVIININYMYKDVIFTAPYKITVYPMINYNMSNITFVYNTQYITEEAQVNPKGGIFSIDNINVNINSINGIISFNKKPLSRGTHKINVIYTLNCVSILYPLLINVL